MRKIAHVLIACAAVIGFAFHAVAAESVNMVPPASGKRNSVTYNGRTYSATPGMAIPVPDFDAPILEANGWSIATSISTSTVPAESPFAPLLRVARKPAPNGPTLNAPLIGARPWAATTAFATGAVVSKGGRAYIATTGGTSGATWANTRGIGQTDASVTWDYIGPQTAPQVVGIDAATHDAALTNILTMESISTLPAGQGPVRWRGGPLTETTLDGYWGPTSVSVPSGGVVTTTRNQAVGGMEFICECTKVEFAVRQGIRQYNFIVDGRNIDMDAVTSGGASPHYFTLDFTNTQPVNDSGAITGRGRRHIWVEFSVSATFLQIATEPTGTFSYPPYAEEWSLALIADSQGAGVIVAGGSFTKNSMAWGQQLVKMLDVPDICNSSIGQTGLVNAGAFWNYGAHALTDLALCHANRPIKYIVIQGSTNDIGQSFSAVTANAVSLVLSLRAAYPTVPIFVTGVIGSSLYDQPAQTDVEVAVFAGLAGMTNVYTIPISTASPKWFIGKGEEGTPTGGGNTDLDILGDQIHLSGQGAAYMAMRVAQAILAIAGAN